MAEIKMSRVDARLVHGQVAARWIKTLSVDRVIIIEDECAKDPFMVEIFQLLSPPGTKIVCYGFDQALEEWKKNEFGNDRVMLLFKYPESAEKAWRMGINYPSLNIAQIPSAPGRKLVHKTICMSDAQMDLLEALANDGVNVYSQPVPEDDQVSVVNIIKKARG